MRNRVGVILFLALASGLLAAFLAFRFLRQPAMPGVVQAAEAPTVGVVLAAQDLEPGQMVTQQDIRMVDWPAGSVPEGFSTSPDEVVGRGVILPIRINEPLLSTKLASREGGAGLQATIAPGERGVAVRVNEIVGIAGWIRAGMRVDVLVTLDQGSNIDEPITKLVLQDVLVLGIGQNLVRTEQDEPLPGQVVILAVYPDEAEQLTLMATKGSIQLALRNSLDRDTVDTRGVVARELIAGRRAPTSSGPRRVVPRQPSSVTVEVYRGSDRKVEAVDPGSSGGGDGGGGS